MSVQRPGAGLSERRARPAVQDDQADLSALIGSRICHDLIGPLGAIGNGVELMTITGPGQAAGQELSLISECTTHAQARVRFYRVAFGTSAPDTQIPRADLRAIVAGMWPGARFHVSWDAAGPVPRMEAKLALLLLMCTEAALPRGGLARADRTETGAWRIEAHGAAVRPGPGWTHLTEGAPLAAPTPADVQFLLAGQMADTLGRDIHLTAGAEALQIVA